MSGTGAEIVSLVALGAVLAFAIAQPRGWPEAVTAVPVAALLVLLNVVSPSAALAQIRALGPVIGFLAAILVIAHLADHAGVFQWLGGRMAALSRGEPRRLLRNVFLVAALTTAVLSLDATVVLLTPVVFLTATSLGLSPRPHVYASGHLANSASTLLPVSNLTNLLAFATTGLPFLAFAGVMALPWLTLIGVEYVVFRRFFRADLSVPRETALGQGLPGNTQPLQLGPRPRAPRFALSVLAATLIGFGISGFVALEPVWVAIAGAAVLALPALIRRDVTLPTLFREAAPLFCLFVLALGIVVAGVTSHGLGQLLARSLPTTPTFVGILVVAAVSAALANVVNNLPATLLVLGALGTTTHPGLVMAMLIGVNVGPNLTYIGSLATLLWRRVLAGRNAAPALTEFTRLGALTVPLGLSAGTAALWVALHIGRLFGL
jgi:arsenical pump membrane protein